MDSRVATLRAVADTLLPSLEAPADEAAAAGDGLAAALLRHSSGGSDDVALKVLETVEARLPAETRRELNLLLRLLGSRLGSLLLMGRCAFTGFGLPSAFPSLPLRQREAVLLAWAQSPDARMRKAFKALKSLTMIAQFTWLGPQGNSPLLQALGYPVGDPLRPPTPAPAAAAAEAAVAAALVDLSTHDGSPGSAAGAGAALAAKGMRVAWPGDFAGAPALGREGAQLAVQCDVVIIGSGAGGGVAAANLARAGLRVVVLEKAGFVPTRDMTLQEGESFERMYEQAGILSSEDGAMSVLAGSTLGGGTRINWCASFKTPPHVRREWAEEHGLPAFASERYDEALDAVCSRLSVHTGFKHSSMCSALRTGLQGLGVHCAEVPRNCLNADCGGHCCLGCSRGYKQDTVNTWLADACQAGARIITGAWAEKVLWEAASPKDGDSQGHVRHKRAEGVLVLAGSSGAPLKLAIQAPIVISAAGSLHSPALLQRSRITCSGNVGGNLRLHPCTCVVGLFPPEPACGVPNGSASSTGSVAGSGVDAGAKQEQGRQQGAAAGSVAGGTADIEDLAGTAGSPAGTAARSAAVEPAGPAAEKKQQEEKQERRLHMLPSRSSGANGGGSIRCWEGTLMSIFSNQAGDWEGGGYGSLLYTPAVHPGLFAAAAPWLGGDDFKHLMLQYPNCCTVLVLTRDSGSGRVVADRTGRPRIHYSLSPEDAGSMMRGVELGLRCMAAAGATTVMTISNSPEGRFSFDNSEAAVAAAAAAAGTAQAVSGGSGGSVS